MRYSQKFPGVRRGMHAPDERLYRLDERRQCGSCGVLTDWTDIKLEVPVCSEECRYQLVTAPRRERRMGALLIKEGLVTEAQLEAALLVQRGLPTYTPIGQVLVTEKLITARQLNTVLDKYGKRPQLGSVLIAAGTVTEAQLSAAVLHQKQLGLRLGDTLIRLGFVTEAQLRQAICIQLNVPFLNLEHFIPDPSLDLTRVIKRSYAEKHRIVPLARLGDTLTVAMDDPTDIGVIEMLRSSTGLIINVVTATRAGLLAAHAKLYAAKPGGPPGTSPRG